MEYYFKTPLGTMAEVNETSEKAKKHIAKLLGVKIENVEEITFSEFKGEE